ncbi:MAG: response regulator [bacterium]
MSSEGKKILIIDDDEDLVEANKIVLEAYSYEVVCAYNGKDGFDLALKEKPDLIMLDVSMEKKDEGFYVSQKIRRHPEIGNTPILMISAIHQMTKLRFSPETDKEYLPVNEFIDKPIDPARLIELVKKWVRDN